MTPCRVVVVGLSPREGITGGRYHMLLMLEALALGGHRVVFWTNLVPPFWEEFRDFPKHGEIRCHEDPGFQKLPDMAADVVIVVPHLYRYDRMYLSALKYVRREKARLVLINFESPNWFNAFVEEERDPGLFRGNLLVSAFSNSVASSTEEGKIWGKEYYQQDGKGCSLDVVYPSINNLAANEAGPKGPKRRLMCITRFGALGSHKGGGDMERILDKSLVGACLTILTGGGLDEKLLDDLRTVTAKNGIELEVFANVTEERKFELLKECFCFVFLSRFEGLGLPPIEACYCGIPCVAFDLPVLRETVGNCADFVDVGDFETVKKRVVHYWDHREQLGDSEPCCDEIRKFEFNAYADRLSELLSRLMGESPSRVSRMSTLPWYIFFCRELFLLKLSNLRKRVFARK